MFIYALTSSFSSLSLLDPEPPVSPFASSPDGTLSSIFAHIASNADFTNCMSVTIFSCESSRRAKRFEMSYSYEKFRLIPGDSTDAVLCFRDFAAMRLLIRLENATVCFLSPLRSTIKLFRESSLGEPLGLGSESEEFFRSYGGK